jgi:hypothetical protein
MKEVDWVTIGPIVGGLNPPITPMRIADLRRVMPTRGQHDNPTIVMANMMWDYVRPIYEKWKQGEEIPVEGTPLAAWNRLTQKQVEVLRAHGFYTVEQIAHMSDANMEKFPIPRPRELKKQAEMFLASADQAQFSRMMEEKEKMISAQGDQIEEQRQQLAELQKQMAQFLAMQQADDEPAPKRGPGRPPKVQQEAAA